MCGISLKHDRTLRNYFKAISIEMFWVAAVVLLIFLLYKWANNFSTYFEKRGIPHVKASLLKTMVAMAANSKPLTEWILEWASEMKDER